MLDEMNSDIRAALRILEIARENGCGHEIAVAEEWYELLLWQRRVLYPL